MRIIKHSLLEALKNTEDVPSFVYILHYLYKKALEENFISKDKNNGVQSNYMIQQFVDSAVLEVLDFLPASNKYSILVVISLKYSYIISREYSWLVKYRQFR